MGLYKRCGCATKTKCDHVWWYRFEAAGQEYRGSTGESSRRAAAQKERDERSKAPTRPRGRRLTIADLVKWDAERAIAKGCTDDHLEHGIGYLWDRITDHFDARADASILTTDTVQAYVVHRRGKKVTDSIRRELGALKRAMAYAKRHGYRQDIDWPEVGGATGKKRVGKVHPIDVLREWLAQLPRDARETAEFVLLTAVRDGALRRIEWSWVEGDVLVIPRGGTKDYTKAQAVPLTPRALEILSARAERHGGPLFQSEHKTAYRLARDRIGYAPTITHRDLRKTWGTWATQRVGVDAARDGLGHSNIAMTHRYVGADHSRVATASRLLGEKLAEETGTANPAQSRKMPQMERANGLEPSTLSLEGRARALLQHLSSCKHCQAVVAGCIELQPDSEESGTEARHRLKVVKGP